jgi:hypothetical protein
MSSVYLVFVVRTEGGLVELTVVVRADTVFSYG